MKESQGIQSPGCQEETGFHSESSSRRLQGILSRELTFYVRF